MYQPADFGKWMRSGWDREAILVPTIAEARVMIRSGDEVLSRCDTGRPDERGTAGTGGVGWFPQMRGANARPCADRAVGECRYGVSRDCPGSGVYAGHSLQMAGPLRQQENGRSE